MTLFHLERQNPSRDHADANTIFVCTVILLFSSTTLPRNLVIGEITGLAILTILVVYAAFIVWLRDPITFSPNTKSIKRSIIAAISWCTLSFIIFPINIHGIHNLIVFVGFFLFFSISARDSALNPLYIQLVDRSIRLGGLIASILYLATIALFGHDSSVINPASASLYFILAFSFHLVSTMNNGLRDYVACIYYFSLAIFSLSRTPVAVCLLLLFIYAIFFETGKKKFLGLVATIILLTGTTIAVVYYPPLNQSFFHGDNALTVGDYSLNTSGRKFLYLVTIHSFQEAPILGKGAGSVSTVLRRYTRIGQPHNDYLRLLHDYGVVGFAIWLFFLFSVLGKLFRMARMRRGEKNMSASARYRIACFLSYLSLLLTMLTDNSLIYPHFIFPIAILSGSSLGISSTNRLTPSS